MVQGQNRAPRISAPVKEEEAKGDNDNTEKIQGAQQFLSQLQIDPIMVETMMSQAEMTELSVAQKPEKDPEMIRPLKSPPPGTTL